MTIKKAVKEDNLSRAWIEWDGHILNTFWLKLTIKEVSSSPISFQSKAFRDNFNPTFSNTNITTLSSWKDIIEALTDSWESQRVNIWFMSKFKIWLKAFLKLIIRLESVLLLNLKNFMFKIWVLMNWEN